MEIRNPSLGSTPVFSSNPGHGLPNLTKQAAVHFCHQPVWEEQWIVGVGVEKDQAEPGRFVFTAQVASLIAKALRKKE